MPPSAAVYAAAAAFLALLIFYAKERLGRVRAERKLSSVEGELSALKSKAERHEYRLERFELLWYPLVTADAAAKTILGVSSGLPHCRKCALPLSSEKDEWVCRQCLARHPGSLADVTVTDSITRQALEYFQERHPGYRIPK